jgi:hypothetical protein
VRLADAVYPRTSANLIAFSIFYQPRCEYVELRGFRTSDLLHAIDLPRVRDCPEESDGEPRPALTI